MLVWNRPEMLPHKSLLLPLVNMTPALAAQCRTRDSHPYV